MKTFIEAKGGLILEHSSGIRLDREILATPKRISWRDILLEPEQIKRNTQMWQNLLPPSTDYPNGHILEWLISCTMPLVIVGDASQPPLQLHAEFKRFPNTPSFFGTRESYGVRLTPEVGRIADIILTPNLKGSATIHAIELNRDRVILDIGHRLLRLEVYSEQQDLTKLPSLEPPRAICGSYR